MSCSMHVINPSTLCSYCDASLSTLYTSMQRAHGPYSLRIRYLDTTHHQYLLWDVKTCCIANELLICHKIHCAQLAEDQLEFESQRDLDFAVLLLSSRPGIELV